MATLKEHSRDIWSPDIIYDNVQWEGKVTPVFVGLFRICLLANFRYIVLQQLVLRSRFGAADAAAWLLTQDQHIRVHLQRANCQVQFRKRRHLREAVKKIEFFWEYFLNQGGGVGILKLYVKFYWPLFLAIKFTFLFLNLAKIQIQI